MDSHLFLSLKQPSHGNQLIPYAYYNCIMPTILPDVLLHWHVEAEISYVLEGIATYQVGDETFLSKKGDIILIPPNTLHSVHPIPGYSFVTDTFIFHLDLLGYSIMDQCTLDYLTPLYNGSLRLITHMNTEHPAYDEMVACIKEIFSCLKNKDTYYELLLKERLHRLFYLFYKNNCLIETHISKTASIHTDKVKEALQFIHSNYKEPISIKQLANLCHFSEAHFMNFFKQTVGITCVEYIIQFRLQVATDLLKTTDNSISDIASECGFNNLSNFNRKFKDYYKITPTQYRKARL